MNNIKKNYNYLLFSFFLVSILFWFVEMGYSLVVRNKLVFPGAWYGPYCPIHGLAFVLLLIIYKKDGNIFFNILKIAVTVTVVEYLIAFISEEFFNHRIWNYSNKFMNLQGRVCLEMSTLFTITGVIGMLVLEPLVKKIYDKLGRSVKYINIVLSIIMIIDMIVTLV